MHWIQEENRFIFQTYRRQPIVLVRGRGSFVWDIRRKKYLDFFSGLGVNNIGHCHPSVARAVNSQVKKLMHTSNLYYTIPQIRCARELIQRTFSGKVFFSNSGAEANECAVKLARRWGRAVEVRSQKSEIRNEIIAFENSFHGRTLATLTLTGQKKFQKGFDPLLKKVLYARFNHLESVKALVSKRTSAIFVEPVQGEGGVYPAEQNFLKGLRKLCDQRRLLLVFDEVQCGLGRSGELFAYQHYGVMPDILTVAKGLGGGLPIGATLAKDRVASLFGKGDHASTFGGNPVVCAAAEQVLETMDRALLDSVKEKSEWLLSRLKELKENFPALIREVRGIGLMIGVELKVPGEPIVDFCRDHGVLINCTQEKILRFLPPLTISIPEIKIALRVLEKSLDSYKNEKYEN